MGGLMHTLAWLIRRPLTARTRYACRPRAERRFQRVADYSSPADCGLASFVKR